MFESLRSAGDLTSVRLQDGMLHDRPTAKDRNTVLARSNAQLGLKRDQDRGWLAGRFEIRDLCPRGRCLVGEISHYLGFGMEVGKGWFVWTLLDTLRLVAVEQGRWHGES